MEKIKACTLKATALFSLWILLSINILATAAAKTSNRSEVVYTMLTPTDVIFSDYVMFTLDSERSRKDCGRICLETCDCVMFTYYETSTGSECRGHSKVMTSNDVKSDVPGARSFIVRDPSDCVDAQTGTCGSRDGVYTARVGGGTPVSVYCDQTTDGGGWTVFQRRQDGTVDFFRDWLDYENGFGSPDGEYWLGLQTVYTMTEKETYDLRVEMRCGNFSGFTTYRGFRLSDKGDNYTLHLGVRTGGDMGSGNKDSLMKHNNYPFSTRDRDNDPKQLKCALNQKGAFWYKGCTSANFNGEYGTSTGIYWGYWKSSCQFSEMKFRPA